LKPLISSKWGNERGMRAGKKNQGNGGGSKRECSVKSWAVNGRGGSTNVG